MGIKLELENVQENPGRRAVAKMCLNSFWGKFGQRLNMTSTEYVTGVKRFYEIILDDRLDNINTNFINDDIVQMAYNFRDQYIEDYGATNIYIAAFTTSNARLRLYEMLDKLGNRVTYYDTDSVIYIVYDDDDEDDLVKTGCMLGDWTDEIGKDVYIDKFYSTGPKSYGYITNTGKKILKIKGFTLNYENSLNLNIEAMEDILLGKKQKISIDFKSIVRDPKTKKVLTKPISKNFSYDYDKRVVCRINDNLIDTLPYGS